MRKRRGKTRSRRKLLKSSAGADAGVHLRCAFCISEERPALAGGPTSYATTTAITAVDDNVRVTMPLDGFHAAGGNFIATRITFVMALSINHEFCVWHLSGVLLFY